jgi:hypothetical protein
MLCECYNESDLEALRGLAENVMLLLEAVRVYRVNECVEAVRFDIHALRHGV